MNWVGEFCDFLGIGKDWTLFSIVRSFSVWKSNPVGFYLLASIALNKGCL